MAPTAAVWSTRVGLMATTHFGLVSGLFRAPGGSKRAPFGPKCPFWRPRRSSEGPRGPDLVPTAANWSQKTKNPPIIICCPCFDAVAPSSPPALYLPSPLYCKRPLLQSRGYGLFPQSPSCSGASWAGSKGSTPLAGGLLCSTHHAPRLLVKGRFCLRNPLTFLNTYSRALSTPYFLPKAQLH